MKTLLKELIEEHKMQKKYYRNGSFKFYLYKIGLWHSPTLIMDGVKTWFRPIWK